MSDLSYMDRNPMRQALRQPIMGQGIIPGKAFLDLGLIQDRMQAADDPVVSASCIPGGNREINHDAMPGDLSFGLRMVRNPTAMFGASNEWGTTSVAGEDTSQYPSDEAWIQQFYFQGVCATESRISDPMNNANTPDPGHGYALVKAGTISIVNNGPQMIYPGDLVCYRFPKRTGYTDLADTINYRARAGEPSSKFRPHVERFDPSSSTFNGSLQWELSRVLLQKTKEEGGIKGLEMEDFFKIVALSDVFALSSAQEQAAGCKYGSAAIAFAYIETLMAKGLLFTATDMADMLAVTGTTAGKAVTDSAAAAAKTSATTLATNLGVFDGSKSQDDLNECVFAAFDHKKVANKNDKYSVLRGSTKKFLHECITSGWYSRTSTIFARAMNTAAPSDTLHVMVNHTII
jgi:hypothetical protein